ncbi:MAG: hypothetical protein AAGF12_00055 [Myxococcota bacterium]
MHRFDDIELEERDACEVTLVASPPLEAEFRMVHDDRLELRVAATDELVAYGFPTERLARCDGSPAELRILRRGYTRPRRRNSASVVGSRPRNAT